MKKLWNKTTGLSMRSIVTTNGQKGMIYLKCIYKI